MSRGLTISDIYAGETLNSSELLGTTRFVVAAPWGALAPAPASDVITFFSNNGLIASSNTRIPVDTNTDQRNWGPYGQISDSTATGAYVLGGRANFVNCIGSASFVPTTPPTTTNAAADSAYPGGITMANTIAGYDSLNNQTGGGLFNCNHTMMKYNVSGHSTGVGSHASVLAGSHCAALNGNYSEIGPLTDSCTLINTETTEIQTANAIYTTAIGGDSSLLRSQRTTAMGYTDIQEGTGGLCNVYAGVRDVTVGNNCYFNAIVGVDVTVLAAGASYNTGTGRYLTYNHSYVDMIGDRATSPANYTRLISRTQVEANDTRLWNTLHGTRTTNATGTNLALDMSMPAGKVISGLMRVRVHAMRDGSADANNDANYAVSSWQSSVGFRWDGTNGYFYDGSTSDGPGTNPTLALTQIKDDIGVAGAPIIALNTGDLRAYIQGKAATTIHWGVDYDILSVLVS